MEVEIEDAPGAASDPGLPQLAAALDPGRMRGTVLGEIEREGSLRLDAIRVLRHKPGRRALVAYDFASPDGSSRTRLVGKLRARGADRRTHALLAALWEAGFRPGAGRTFAVPEPLGVVEELHMLLLRWLPGESAWRALDSLDAEASARRIATALHGLHVADVPARRRHDVAAELAILRERLERAAGERPDWRDRLGTLMQRCEEATATLPEAVPCGLHRDFYPDQVVLTAEDVGLLDLDLHALGDPALDVGNYSAHLIEAAIRERGDARAHDRAREAFERAYCELAPQVSRRRVDVFTALTLARHVDISMQLPGRGHATVSLLACAEQRLDALRS